MFLERFRNVVQTILTQNPQNFFGLRPDHGFSPPLIRESSLIRGGETMFWTQNPQNFRAFGAIFLLFNYFLATF